MEITIRECLYVCVQEDPYSDNAPFVEIEEIGIPDANEIRIRTNDAARSDGTGCWTREGLHLLAVATAEYLEMDRKRGKEGGGVVC